MPTPDAATANRRAGWRGQLHRTLHSLILRTMFSVALGLALVALALWWMVDRVLVAEAAGEQQRRREQAGAVVAQAIDREVDSLRNLGALLAADTELVNASYYHFMLDGERSHVQASLDRLPQGRRVQAQALLDTAGRVVASSGQPGLPIRPPAAGAEATAALAWDGDRLWVVASAPVQRAGATIAWLVLGSSLQPMVDVVFPPQAGLQVGFAAAGGNRAVAAAGVPVLTLPSSDPSQPVAVWIDSRDVLLPARDKVRTLLRQTLPAAVAVLGLALALGLLWQLWPLRQISAAAERVGHGDLYPRLPRTRLSELAVVIKAFEQMLEGLRAYEALREQSAQQSRLQAIGRMAARVAHDINNPLTVIQTHLALLARSGVAADPAVADAIGKMQHHCDRCHRTVDLLLRYGRPVRLHAVPVQMATLCREAAARLGQLRGGHSIEVIDRSDAATISGDALYLEQLLDNLLTNACDAAPGQPVTVTLDEVDQGVELTVLDRGRGFDEDARQHAFEPFFTTKRDGTGLGLASCLAIVLAHGGRMRILHATPGGGVAAWLPTGQAQRPAIERPVQGQGGFRPAERRPGALRRSAPG